MATTSNGPVPKASRALRGHTLVTGSGIKILDIHRDADGSVHIRQGCDHVLINESDIAVFKRAVADISEAT